MTRHDSSTVNFLCARNCAVAISPVINGRQQSPSMYRPFRPVGNNSMFVHSNCIGRLLHFSQL